MKLLVFGRTGQVATEFLRRAGQGVEVTALGRDVAELSAPESCATQVMERDVDIVLNLAAYTAVDRAEDEEKLALRINGAAPAAMAAAAASRNLPFLHVSTDYVFDGSGSRPWQPNDAPRPLGVYGRTKLAGEAGVRAAGGRHAILRTSWVFSAHGANFVKTMLRLGPERNSLPIVADQIGGPTPAAAIADALLAMARAFHDGHRQSGTWHFSGAPDTSWAGLARETFAQAGMATDVTEIPTSAYPTPAKRPLNSRLDGHLLETDFGIARPDWRAGLADVIKELGV